MKTPFDILKLIFRKIIYKLTSHQLYGQKVIQ